MSYSKSPVYLLLILCLFFMACGASKKQELTLNPGETYQLHAELEYGRVLGDGYNVQHLVSSRILSEFKATETGMEVTYTDISVPVYENNFAKDLPDMEGLDAYVTECVAKEGSSLGQFIINEGSEFIARAYLDPLKIMDKHCLLMDGKKRCETISDTISSYVLEQVLTNIYPPENIMKKGKWEQEFSIHPNYPDKIGRINWSYERDDKLGRYYYGKGNYVMEFGKNSNQFMKDIKWKGVIQLSLYIDPITGWINKGMIEWRQETPRVSPVKSLKTTSQTENLKVRFLPLESK